MGHLISLILGLVCVILICTLVTGFQSSLVAHGAIRSSPAAATPVPRPDVVGGVVGRYDVVVGEALGELHLNVPLLSSSSSEVGGETAAHRPQVLGGEALRNLGTDMWRPRDMLLCPLNYFNTYVIV